MRMAQETNLQSQEHGKILNVIDELRSLGISHHIDLPQVIVCGDQSSGKSSVLEAVSGLTFPRKDNLCTRFAIEVVLRRGPVENVSMSVVSHYTDSSGGTDNGKDSNFYKSHIDLSDMESLIGDAAVAMGIDSSSKNFSQEILRFEVTGPTQPQLTLVDLPGLFQAGNKTQSDEDSKAVTELVLSYMRRTRSIILAVVSAKNDFANQIVTKYARELDPLGDRTLGVITKPDTLHIGSDSELAFFELAENRDVYLRHGWHVLKNRDYDTRATSTTERDEAELDFFNKGIWMKLPRNKVGIESFRLRLSVLLREQILEELPSLIEDVRKSITGCDDVISRLGASRTSIREQRLHLLHASQTFSMHIRSAVDGSYNDSFFEDASSAKGAAKRLRAVAQNILVDFSKRMRQEGHAQHILDDVSKKQRKLNPKCISRSEKIDETLLLMRRSRGCELPGTFNPQIVRDLFFAQARPWEGLLREYIELIWDAVKTTLDLILEQSTDQNTFKGLKRLVIDRMLDSIRNESESMVTTILTPHQRGHPITYNHYLTDNMQKLKESRDRKSLVRKVDAFFGTAIEAGQSRCEEITFDAKGLVNALSQTNIVDMDRYACMEALDCMKSYYKVAMKTFVDDFSVLVIEQQILRRLPGLLTPEHVVMLEDDIIQSIAGEPDDLISERFQTDVKLKALRQAMSLLLTLKRSKHRDPTMTQIVPSKSRDSDDRQDSSTDERPDEEIEMTSGIAEGPRDPSPKKLDSHLQGFGTEDDAVWALGPVPITNSKSKRKGRH